MRNETPERYVSLPSSGVSCVVGITQGCCARLPISARTAQYVPTSGASLCYEKPDSEWVEFGNNASDFTHSLSVRKHLVTVESCQYSVSMLPSMFSLAELYMMR